MSIEKEDITFDYCKDDQYEELTRMINSAYFVSESFFRREGCYDRISLEELSQIAQQGEDKQQVYLVGTLSSESKELICSVCLDWKITVEIDNQEFECSHADILVCLPKVCSNKNIKVTVVGHMGQVSVNPKYQRQGIGAYLISSAENQLMSFMTGFVSTLQSSYSDCIVTPHVFMEMHVLNVRTDMLAYYPRFGYVVERSGLTIDLGDIVLPGFNITACELRKVLV